MCIAFPYTTHELEMDLGGAVQNEHKVELVSNFVDNESRFSDA